ncbi:MFS transporter [Curtobacterium sp. VKM Ac-1376]|uniref:MFS transporter n=1 Tax=Curtobacterium sp. VKM Ac-1376 TaxID=123312 RepID=UPI00188BB01E|nr:MFS transporter [Curtobacterium sp. VKM Ac-1376]MBF4615473.1 MFS transporter [Curtobacterium sp. VKM Ac-1376]
MLLRDRRVSGQLLSVLFATVPLGMFPVAVVLAVHAWTGSFAMAGWVSAAFTGGSAVGLTVQGHLIDRFGPDRTIGVAGGAFVVAVVALVSVGGGPARWAPVVVVLAAVAGASLPEVTTAVRVWLARSELSSPQRVASYSLLGACFQTGLVFGPLLVTVAVVWVSPAGALLVVGAVSAAASAWFLSNVRRGRAESLPVVAAGEEPRMVARSSYGPMLAIFGIAAASGAVGGVATLVIPRVLEAAGSVESSGLLFATLAVGEVVGAVAYGAMRWPFGPVTQLVLVLAGTGVLVAACTFTTDRPWAFGVLLFGIGAASGPVAVLLASATELAAAGRAIGAASGARISVSLLASAAGSAFAGGANGQSGTPVVLAVLASVVLAAAALPFFLRRTLRAGHAS